MLTVVGSVFYLQAKVNPKTAAMTLSLLAQI